MDRKIAGFAQRSHSTTGHARRQPGEYTNRSRQCQLKKRDVEWRHSLFGAMRSPVPARTGTTPDE
jgi:hypothetical protein